MVVVGGATRLTGSGLLHHRMEARHRSAAAAQRGGLGGRFREIQGNPAISRIVPGHGPVPVQDHLCVGMEPSPARAADRRVFSVPFFCSRARPDRGWPARRLAGIFALGGLQGFVGWWMVSSGLSIASRSRRSVWRSTCGSARDSLRRWSGCGGTPAQLPRPTWRTMDKPSARWGVSLLALACSDRPRRLRRGVARGPGLQHLAADGRPSAFVRPDHLFNLTPWTTNFLDNVTIVPFQRRMMAFAARSCPVPRAPSRPRNHRAARRAPAALLAAFVAVQAGLGITTLVLAVPLHAALFAPGR